MEKEVIDYILNNHLELIPMDERARLSFRSVYEKEDDVRREIAQYVLAESRDKIFFNYCPACGKLARTPLARQCRCGHSWRKDQVGGS